MKKESREQPRNKRKGDEEESTSEKSTDRNPKPKKWNITRYHIIIRGKIMAHRVSLTSTGTGLAIALTGK